MVSTLNSPPLVPPPPSLVPTPPSPSAPALLPPPPPPSAAQHPKPILSYPLVKDLNLDSITSKETSAPDAQVLQEPECDALEEEEEEEDDPIFVLTDEWREFFAKSEAKRKLEKQQGKKKEKH
ncbi:hypothetical protein OIU79_016761 [Salix purpurea]|uniref:Uncharacterized protein n=1 Tax=Salix purpurea TaxID=77065 RepID=A0A9Q0PF33_SALPP|nr:hypothetical protein OIU79_016761 [Salix purpurea]